MYDKNKNKTHSSAKQDNLANMQARHTKAAHTHTVTHPQSQLVT